MSKTRTLYCCGCKRDTTAHIVGGSTIYPHRPDLSGKQFWRCQVCLNYVGCHQGGIRPLGVIADGPMKNARRHIHAILDPIWKARHMKRGTLYAKLTDVLGREYHTGELRTLEEARVIYRAVLDIRNTIAAQDAPA